MTTTTDPTPPTDNQRSNRRAARWKFLALAALFLSPIIASTLLFHQGWRPQGSVNHGEVLSPARPIEARMLTDISGQALDSPLFQRKWTMLYFGRSECGSACDRMLRHMRQVHLALGKEAYRVQTLFVATDAGALDWLRFMVKNYPDLRVAAGPLDAVQALARQFSLPAGSPLDGVNRLYIVDPLGNFMMSYPADIDPSDIRKDFVRLLKVSQIG